MEVGLGVVDIILALIFFAAAITAFVSLINFIYPMNWFGMSTRLRSARILFGSIVVLGVNFIGFAVFVVVTGDEVVASDGGTDSNAPTGQNDGALRETAALRSEEHTSELQSLKRIPYDVLCLK